MTKLTSAWKTAGADMAMYDSLRQFETDHQPAVQKSPDNPPKCSWLMDTFIRHNQGQHISY